MKKKEMKKTLLLTMLLVIMVMPSAFGANGEIPKMITGTNALFSTVLKWVLILVPGSTAAFIAYQAWTRGMATDQGKIDAKKKLIWNALKGGIFAESAAGIVAIFFAFYS